MKLARFSTCLIAAFISFTTARGADDELVLAANKKCDYQIVIPDSSGDAIVDGWLTLTAKFTQAVFAKQGFTLPIKAESYKEADKPSLYLGATRFAKSNGVDVEPLEDWTYFQKVVGHDVIIAGHDKKDPAVYITRFAPPDSRAFPLARLGTLKGVCDFLRQYAGVRFLFMNSESGWFPDGNIEAKGVLDGTPLRLDTRSIAILPQSGITVPSDLNVQKKPLMRACADIPRESLYLIANNFFPQLGSLQGARLNWSTLIPNKRNENYSSAKAPGQMRAGLNTAFSDDGNACPSSKSSHDAISRTVQQQIAAGHKYIHFVAASSTSLVYCKCKDCKNLFGSAMTEWDSGLKRARSGKLWLAYFKFTERFRTTHPHVRFVIESGLETPISADVIKRFPDNVIPQIELVSQRDFDKLSGIEFPAGICATERTINARAGPYIAEHTPEYFARLVKALARNKVLWTTRERSLGSLRGLSAPAYYVYGRMMDDPTADWPTLMDEFCHAAFGEATGTMGQFFQLFHSQIAIYSDMLGTRMPWDSRGLRTPYQDSKWCITTIYTPEFCADADRLLKKAESEAQDPDAIARLKLIRIEFDYACQIARIFHLHNAWQIRPTQAKRDLLADSIDAWRTGLQKLSLGQSSIMKPLPGWFEMKPFGGQFYSDISLASVDSGLGNTCLNWDTRALRAGVLDDKHELKVTTATAEPAIDSAEWDKIPPSYFRLHQGMPSVNISTSMKVLRDQEHLYVRIECENPNRHSLLNHYSSIPDSDNVFLYDWVELALTPPNDPNKVYRIAVNMKKDSRFDAVYELRGGEMVEDLSWTGAWQVKHYMAGTPTALGSGQTWITMFKIPFFDLGPAPDSGSTWSLNACRGRSSKRALWLDTPDGSVIKALGKLRF